MTIELHTWNTPNGRKISVALEEMGLPYKVVPVNISKGEQMAPPFLAISPNNKIPAIVDPDGPDGQRVSVFESGAILLYLGEKTGKFLPKPLIERIPVYEWLMWQMGGFGPMPGQVHHFIALENEQERAYGLKRYMAETRRLYGELDRRLAGRAISVSYQRPTFGKSENSTLWRGCRQAQPRMAKSATESASATKSRPARRRSSTP